MFKRLFLSLACMLAASAYAADAPVWQNPAVNQQNREPRRAAFFPYESQQLAIKGQKAGPVFVDGRTVEVQFRAQLL